jgi:hypothetical protein
MNQELLLHTFNCHLFEFGRIGVCLEGNHVMEVNKLIGQFVRINRIILKRSANKRARVEISEERVILHIVLMNYVGLSVYFAYN